ncbi:protein-disulfide reductase DsbD family protein [Siccirubricoccus phaeus]|uniref:protein-disulfide reductase DsbD family protein n=1 Tax=Siccirubricoccus phaeus TaxID=2595053 RepID=UPI0011F3D03A|nr:thioredoxin family protein [Siccirubricoccus phaeus]
MRLAWTRIALPTLAGLLALLLSPGGAGAIESTAQQSPRATVTLVSEAAAVAPGESFRIGLRQRLAPHWHTYWTNPGDAGTPPEIALTLPEGVTSGEIAWPGPDRLPFGPLVNFGYENEIVLPMTVTVPPTAQPGRTLPIEARASWLVCERECIPEEGSFRIEVPVEATGTPAGGEIAAAFAAADARRPVPSPWPSRLGSEGEALVLAVEGEDITPAAVKGAFFFPAAWGAVEHAAPQALQVENGRLTLSLARGQALDASAPLAGLLAVSDGTGQTRWLELAPRLGPLPAGGGAGAAALALPFWQAALFAFLGGLILNLMPCVFPVLAIKATAVARMSGGALRQVRLSGLFYTIGVLVAFTALAALLLAVRASGAAVGWGFQFQSPVFVTLMVWLLLAIGLNLSGVFEVGQSLSGTGQSLATQQGHGGSFFTGLLAVVVATPCTAPFMGAAIGTALAAPPALALALFLAMGLGLALPYALLGIFPRIARTLPRPGAWMLRLRQGMAFPMYASAAWLVWVLVQQTGELGVLVALAGGVLIGLAAWLYGIAQHSGGRALFSRGAAALALAGTLALLPQLRHAAAPGAQAASTSGAEPFTAARLAALRAEGKPVFVNMTAAWCITCKVNERAALATAGVQAALAQNGITYLRGDWTNQDPQITEFLRGFGRDGLPFYVFFPAGKRDPVVLPPVLTESIVTAELTRNVSTP